MNNTLLMPFIDESESFTNGFECGQIWEKISQGEILEKYLCHSENEEQIKMICESFGVKYHFEEAKERGKSSIYSSGWMYLSTKSVLNGQ